MHYIALFLVSAVTISSTIFAIKQGWVGRASETEQTLSSTSVSEPLESAFSKLKKPVYFKPVKLQITTSDIQIDQVGLQKDGMLDIPSSWDRAGWYVKSAKPGQSGNIIIDGHYDDSTGKPAAFWDLKGLSQGDKVQITDEKGREFTYQVSEIFFVDISDPDRTRIFDEGEEDKSEITLVTCGGVWDPSKGTYSKRLIVSGYLVQ